MPTGRGLKQAIGDRSGVSAIRCLAARQPSHIGVSVTLAESANEIYPWRYEIGVEQERRERISRRFALSG